ncbi:MAG: glycosyltransferase, partial [Acetobacteraceae bacterium]
MGSQNIAETARPGSGSGSEVGSRRPTERPIRVPAPEIAVVIPCYNERANIHPLIARLDAALAGERWEVIFVDDASPDGTAAEALEIAASDQR